MFLEIITPEKIVFKEEIDELIIPTIAGQIAILPNHINLFTTIVPGEMIIKIKNKEQSLAITGGYLEINSNTISILADFAVRTEEIEVEKALEAQKRAQDILKNAKENVNERDFANAEAELRRSILQLDVANRKRKRPL